MGGQGHPLIDDAFVRRFLDDWNGNGTDELDLVARAKTCTTEDGEVVARAAGVSHRYGRFLYSLVRRLRPRRVLEIGLATGVSAMYIAAAQRAASVAEPELVTVDPFQTTDWRGAGRTLLREMNLDSGFEVIERPSYVAVPELEQAGRRFDFVFIDGNHCLDYTLADVLVCDRVLERGGLLALDDSTNYGVKMAIPYLDRFRTNLQRVRLDGPVVHWLREHVVNRRRITVYQKVAEDARGADAA